MRVYPHIEDQVVSSDELEDPIESVFENGENSVFETAGSQLRFVVSIALYSLVALVPLFIWEVCYSKMTDAFPETAQLGALKTVDVSNLEKAILAEHRVEDYSFIKIQLADTPFLFLPFYGYFPLLMWFYIGDRVAGWKWTCPVIVSLLTGYIAVGLTGSRIIEESVFALSVLLACITCKLVLPSSSRIHWLVFGQLVVVFVGISTLDILRNIPSDDVVIDNIRFLLLLPLFREFVRILSVYSAWYLWFDSKICGHELKPNRMYAWGFLGWIQIFSAVYYRLCVSTITSSGMATLVIIYQGTLEVFMRISISWRDEKLRAVKKCIQKTSKETQENFKRRRSTDIVLSRTSTRSILNRRITKVELKKEAKEFFYSFYIVTDMIFEYVAIIYCAFLVAFHRNDILFTPLEHYRKFYTSLAKNNTTNPFEETMPLNEVYYSALGQIFVEVLVDVICSWYEVRVSGYDLSRAWADRPKQFSIIFIAATLIGHVAAFPFARIPIKYHPSCYGNDMCACDDLTPTSLEMLYCQYVYPDSQGSPPGFSNNNTLL